MLQKHLLRTHLQFFFYFSAAAAASVNIVVVAAAADKINPKFS